MFFRRSVVAVMVQNAIEHTAIPGRNHDAAKIANIFVANLWEAIPDLIAGKKGPKPSNFALALGAMTNGLHRTEPGSEAEDVVFLALGSLLQTPQAAKAAMSNRADAFLHDRYVGPRNADGTDSSGPSMRKGINTSETRNPRDIRRTRVSRQITEAARAASPPGKRTPVLMRKCRRDRREPSAPVCSL